MSQVTSAAPAPFAGIRVLDLTRVLSGPLATQMLADFGAEVIRVVRPGKEADIFRASPPFLKDREGRETSESSLYLSCNRNKKSLSVDIATPAGQDIIRRLAAKSDVIVENCKAGDLARYGLDYDSLRESNPGLVYCSITGFGQTGPGRARPGYDGIFQAYSGMMSLTGHPDGAPGAGPLKTGPAIADAAGSLHAAFAIAAALHHRGSTGRGQYIDISLLDTTVALIAHYGMHYLAVGQQPARCGNANLTAPAVDAYACSDGTLMLSASDDAAFRRLCGVLGMPEVADDERFSGSVARAARRAEVEALLVPRIAAWRRADLLAALDRARVPVAPINDLAQAFADPQLVHRGMVVEAPHPLAGTLRMVANPIRFSETPVARYEAPPLSGEHTDQVLADLLGMSPADIGRLRAEKVV